MGECGGEADQAGFFVDRSGLHRSDLLAAERLAHDVESARQRRIPKLLLGGALTQPADAAVLLFQGDSPEVAERFARTDPYVINGLVKRWYVREWKTVAGSQAAAPLRPASD